jgi:hypothetical protein
LARLHRRSQHKMPEISGCRGIVLQLLGREKHPFS